MNKEIYLNLDECDENRFERAINVTPTQSPIELYEKEKDVEMFTLRCKSHHLYQTPLISRCSSMGSLSNYEQHSLLNDNLSSISDFSKQNSKIISPCKLSDSFRQSANSILQNDTIFLKTMNHYVHDSSQDCKTLLLQQNELKQSIFDDSLSVFKEESTPVKFHSIVTSSLSSLVIDDEDDINYFEKSKNKDALIETSKKFFSSQISDLKDKIKLADGVTKNMYFLVDEEEILDEYIRKGIAKITKQHLNSVSLLNLQSNNSFDSDLDKYSDLNNQNNSIVDESSDLSAEEEQLLDECIRKGIAKVTRQNLNEVTSLSLSTKFVRLNTSQNYEETNLKIKK